MVPLSDRAYECKHEVNSKDRDIEVCQRVGDCLDSDTHDILNVWLDSYDYQGVNPFYWMKEINLEKLMT